MQTERNPYEVFETELPELAQRFDEIVQAQIALPGLDQKTKQLLNIAIQTANRNPRGVTWHAMMARAQGATREEVVGAVAMNLHLSGLAVVLESLPAAVSGYEMPSMTPA
ncbi:MAG: carboxymuconolactone decarboxylase family protein [Actinomycetota bacterium]